MVHYLFEDGIEKIVLQDHCLSSLGKPCDAKLIFGTDFSHL